jgi:hypothetical protein
MNRSYWFVLAIAASAFVACGGSSGSSSGWNTTSTTTARGAITGSTTTGSMDVTFAGSRTALYAQPRNAEISVTVSGSALVNGTALTLHGTFDTVTGVVLVYGDIAGTPNAYTFNATVAHPATDTSINGSWTGPGSTSGNFSVQFVPTGGSVTVYCGSFEGDDTGTWNLVVSSDGKASGNFVTSDNSVKGTLTGTVAGGSATLTWGGATKALGPISATSAGDCNSGTGTWSLDGTTINGCWQGSPAGCNAI